MPQTVVDLRSDTVTEPTPEMRDAMARAEVGDDVFGNDPTINALQDRVAELLGKEAALYVPSGTMANQIAIRAQTEAGDEIIGHEDGHIIHYESGAPAALSGVSVARLRGAYGMFTAEDVSAVIRSPDSHYPKTSLVVVENTHNRGGGTIWNLEQIKRIRSVADEHALRMHLDGARLMNAVVATGISAAEWAESFDSVSICFSKGLGAPVGSALAGSAELIQRAHRFRKMFGGGMRQAGIVAAGALYALEHHVDRLAEDHANAKKLAEAMNGAPGISVDLDAVQTNIVYCDVDPSLGTAAELCGALADRGVLMLPLAPTRVRALTHLDVSADDIEIAANVIREVAASGARA